MNAAAEPPLLRIQNLSKRYARGSALSRPGRAAAPVLALDNVSFTLQNGLYGLLGPNGAGKSTLLRILCGALAPTSGQVLWQGRPIGRLGEKYRAVLGYMPQQQALYDGFTARRFLAYFCALKQLPRGDVRAEVERAAALVHLQDELDKTIAAYSGGMKQRLLAASALLGSPRLLILDEPTAGLDPKERIALRRVLRQCADNTIVLAATHVVQDVEDADELIFLKNGRIIARGAPLQLTQQFAPGGGIEQVYLDLFEEEGL